MLIVVDVHFSLVSREDVRNVTDQAEKGFQKFESSSHHHRVAIALHLETEKFANPCKPYEFRNANKL
jgi:hypothetical protein